MFLVLETITTEKVCLMWIGHVWLILGSFNSVNKKVMRLRSVHQTGHVEQEGRMDKEFKRT